MADDYGRRIAGIVESAPTRDGHAIYFDLGFEDRTTKRFHMLFEDFPKLYNTLRGVYAAAQKLQHQMPGGPPTTANPFRIERLEVRAGPNDTRYFRMITRDSFPLDIEVTPAVAKALTLAISSDIPKRKSRRSN